MVRLFTILIGLMAMSSSFAESNTNPFESYLWKYRLIVVQASEQEAPTIVSALKKADADIVERHIIWFVLGEKSSWTNQTEALPEGFAESVRERLFDSKKGHTQVALIGKDGGVKSRNESLDLTNIFSRIDAMPMRRAEMRETE